MHLIHSCQVPFRPAEVSKVASVCCHIGCFNIICRHEGQELLQLALHCQDGRLLWSSQESFFDSPDDPYFFDSQTSSFEASQPSASTQLQHHQLALNLPTSSTISSQAQSRTEQVIPGAKLEIKLAGPVSAQPKAAASRSLSRLSKSSSHVINARPDLVLPPKHKHSLTSASSLEGPAAKKACLKRQSGSNLSQGGHSGSNNAGAKQNSAPATTVLEVTSLDIDLLFFFNNVCAA